MAPEQVAHYELVRLIGRGGMGEVHEAMDLKLRRRVALKFLSHDLTADTAALARFEREARSAAELAHPHIATVYAFEPEGAKPFIALELLAGPGLRDHIAMGPLPIPEALSIARDVAAALAFAHRRGIAHRDIKPENLMFDEHGKIKVMDFGLARASMASKLTVTGTSLGTPAYMSPEAIRGESGQAGDVWALGLVLWEMLTGGRAYPGDNAMAVMFAIANDDPPPIRTRRPDVPLEVEQLLARMLTKDPQQRIDAATAAAELSVLTGVPVPAMSGAFANASTTAAPSPAELSTMRTQAVVSRGEPISSGTAAALMTASPTAARVAFSPRRIVIVTIALVIVVGTAATLVVTAMHARARAEAADLNDRGLQAAQAGNTEAARTLFTRSIGRDPTNTSALSNLGLMALGERRYPQAESLLEAALAHAGIAPKSRAVALMNLASLDMDQKYYERAITRLHEAFDLDSSAAGRYSQLGYALLQNRQAGDALALLSRGIRRFPGEPYLYKNAGLAAQQLGNPKMAFDFFDAAVRLDSTFHEAADLRAGAAAELGARH